MCNPEGSENNLCNVDTGHCYCKRSIEGDNCDQCIEGYFGFPTCQGNFHQPSKVFYHKNNHFELFSACSCNEEGSVGNTCDNETGACTCRPNTAGHRCDKCAPGYFGFPDCQRKLFFLQLHFLHLKKQFYIIS